MAISIRGNAGAWVASNATTQTVTLPTHVAGDMLIVRAAQKPYSAAPTCATAGWAATGTAYQNGTTANGNGVGSVKLIAFWKIATSASETNPVVTWNTTSAPGACCPVVYQKGADETWVTPVGAGGGDATLRTAHTATISSHISTTAGDMVDFFTFWGDNYAATVPTFTQAGVTFGTVAEQPATALSDATSNDCAADGGYRLASSGTSSAAAIVTGTFGNLEQGGSWTTRLRVEAAAPQLVTPGVVALTTALFAPTVTVSDNVVVTPGVVALATSLFAPTVTTTDHQLVTPGLVALTLATFAPTVTASDNIAVVPGVVALALSPLAPTVTASDNITATPDVAALITATFAPVVAVSEGVTATPDAATLSLSAFAPTVTASDHQTATPPIASLTLAAFAPTVTVSDHQTVTPPAASLTLAVFAPTVTATAHVTATPDTVSLTISPFAPIVTASDHTTITPGAATLAMTAFAPNVVLTDHKLVTPTTAALALTAFAPNVILTDHKVVTPDVATFTLATFAPTVTVASASQLVTPEPALLMLTTFAPTVAGDVRRRRAIGGGAQAIAWAIEADDEEIILALFA